eukprot:TRINITY_DN23032_c0_g1_i1.p2 TRINITY_DN23032_c0_g1~~TRINITY_DN23032_c0_g1_i1.p2  ORF type:complete len:250 (+),score=36.04 TRINITY_DN23032_c0_g1_i1:157-906(+)
MQRGRWHARRGGGDGEGDRRNRGGKGGPRKRGHRSRSRGKQQQHQRRDGRGRDSLHKPAGATWRPMGAERRGQGGGQPGASHRMARPAESLRAPRQLCDFQWLAESSTESKVRYHVIYWEGSNQRGIEFRTNHFFQCSASRNFSPGQCGTCGSIHDAFKTRVDNMQATLRTCLDPGGQYFREEIVDFQILSPGNVVTYRLQPYQAYHALMDTRAVDEKNVLGTAIEVLRGSAQSDECGVHIANFGHQYA